LRYRRNVGRDALRRLRRGEDGSAGVGSPIQSDSDAPRFGGALSLGDSASRLRSS
jgi:hypothetical protein